MIKIIFFDGNIKLFLKGIIVLEVVKDILIFLVKKIVVVKFNEDLVEILCKLEYDGKL